MTLRIVAGSANPLLAGAVAEELGTEGVSGEVERFPDGELRPLIEDVRGDDVYIVESTGPPVNEHLVELALLLDACRRGGADRITAVVPYFGYARQDRRSRAGQAVGARVAADIIVTAGADRLLVVDPHTPALEAMLDIPVDMITAVRLLARSVGPMEPSAGVVVAPDLGAVKLAQHYALLLGLPVAIVRKTRLSGSSVAADELAGDVEGRRGIIVDDMITTGATIEAAARVLVAHGADPAVTAVATHGLLVGDARTRLDSLHRLLVTDTVPVGIGLSPALEVRSVASLLGDAIGRLHRQEPLDDLLIRT